MQSAHGPLAKLQTVLSPLHKSRRLAEVVRMMAQEIERLEEDNIQLRAALEIYREAARVSDSRARQAKSAAG